MPTLNEIADRVQKISERIQKGEFSKEELINLYDNAMKFDGISDVDKERIVAHIEKELRLKYPLVAKKIFGSKDAEARRILLKIHSAMEKDFDLSGNKVNLGVKTGGEMFKGTEHVRVYISYKNAENVGAGISLKQLSADDELKIIVNQYRTGKGKSGILQEHEFGLDELQKAESIYRDYLSEIAN